MACWEGAPYATVTADFMHGRCGQVAKAVAIDKEVATDVDRAVAVVRARDVEGYGTVVSDREVVAGDRR